MIEESHHIQMGSYQMTQGKHKEEWETHDLLFKSSHSNTTTVAGIGNRKLETTLGIRNHTVSD